LFYSAVAIGGTSALVVYNVGTSKWSDSHTWNSAIKHYLTNKFMVFLGFVSFRELVKQSNNIRDVQSKFLMQQIESNKTTCYGKSQDFESISTVSDFLTKHPLTKYDHYKPYVDKIIAGDLLALTNEVPLQLAVTSGTSGLPTSKLPVANYI